MKKNITAVILVTAGAFLFNMIFWHEKLGVNTVLFDAFILAALFFLYPQARQHATVRWLFPGHLTCLAMVIVHNTLLSKLGFVVTLALLAGFSEYVHRSVLFAGGSVLMNIVMMAASFAEPIQFKRPQQLKRRTLSRIIRFAVFPLLLLLVFFYLYSSANTIFSKLSAELSRQLQLYFTHFFDLFSWQRLLFLLLGLLISGGLLLKSRLDYFSHRDIACNDELQRKRITLRKRREGALFQFVETFMGRMVSGMLALKNENTIGIITLVLLNALLLVINIIDVDYLWFNFTYQAKEPVYKMVHEGTELLIASIVLAMAILLLFFKGNLNFYRRNKWLKWGAYAWIIQNTILVSSVLLRDYYYIMKHGLAYKRIGVLFFLLMVLVGLFTVFVKIWQRKTNYFLFRVNAWAGVVVLVMATTIHWDELIAGYNLQRKDRVPLDAQFLLTLSDKTLPMLHKNIAALQEVQPQIQRREEAFLQQQQAYSWLSWNYTDAQVKKFYQHKQ